MNPPAWQSSSTVRACPEKLTWLRLPVICATLLVGARVLSAQLLVDRDVTIHSTADLAHKRQALIDYLWGPAGFPRERLPDEVRTNIPTPVHRLDQLRRVDELRINLGPGLQGLAYHFLSQRPSEQLVVLHHGHACTLDDDPGLEDRGNGLQRTIQALLANGYDVLGVFMPHMRPGDCTGDHEAMFKSATAGSPIRLFLESTALSLNYLKCRSHEDQFPQYRAYHMVGLSGGGWTTTVYAALDPTIRVSVSVAGTIPLYLRSGGSIGDREQFEPSFYRIAGYPDLYVLGAGGEGRRQVQVVLRHDDCCFGEAQHDSTMTGLGYLEAMRDFEGRVRAAMKELSPGTFRLEIDETAPSHMISHYAIEKILLPELRAADPGKAK
jgi:hypothetical protein